MEPERDLLLAERARARERVAALEREFAGLAEGRYGVCDRCGQPIGAERLAARPAAVTCVRCAGGGRRRV